MTQSPGLLPPSPHRYPMRKRLLWPWFVAVGTLLFIAAAFAIAFWVKFSDNTRSSSLGEFPVSQTYQVNNGLHLITQAA